MQFLFGWAQRPMLSRLKSQLDPSVPITVICGAKSWVNRSHRGNAAELIKEARPKAAYTAVEILPEARHHLHAEQPQEFNRIVKEMLDAVDHGKDHVGTGGMGRDQEDPAAGRGRTP